MENISQKDIDKICEILKNNHSVSLATKLKKADVISALYVLNYLNVVDMIRKNTQVLDDSSATSIKYKMKKNNFESFKKELGNNYHLELDALITTKEEFEGAMWLLFNSLERQHLICDFNDGVHTQTKIGKCESEYHSDYNDDNPSNQKLTLNYEYSEDNQKLDKRYPIYICKKCQDEINENGEGSVSCDMELSA